MSRDLDRDFTDRKTDWDTVHKSARAKYRNHDVGRQPKQETASGQMEDTITKSRRTETEEAEKSEEKTDEASTALIYRKASEFHIVFRENKNLNEGERKEIQDAVQDGGVEIDCKTYIDKEKLSVLFATDKAGAAIVVDVADSNDKLELGDKTYLSTPEVVKEQTKRLEKPESALKQEKLKQARDNVEDFSNNPELQRERVLARERIDREQKKVKEQVKKARNTDVSELSGRPLDGDAEVHHLHRVADQPEKALDPDNMMVLKKDEHRGFHRSDYPPTPDGLREYAEEHREEWEAELGDNGDD